MFTINYKGTNCRGIDYNFKCTKCGYEQTCHANMATVPASIKCDACGCDSVNKLTAFALDADHHDSMRSHNLGWDEDA